MSAKHTLNVDLGARSYPIYIGDNLISEATLIADHILGNSVMVVTNTTVSELYLKPVTDSLNSLGLRHNTVILEDGEQYKNIGAVETIIESLLQNRHDRQTTVIALGGGVVGDIAGFAASIYQRGVNVIQIPTTLLSQVDSSVGGKTGVNHPLGKNMIGAFYQPQCVIADTATLETLPARELSAGLAEVIKYGLIYDAGFFSWIENNMSGLLNRDNTLLGEAIRISCETKAKVVAQDERESGIRAILNLGHTFGHAIETEMGYGNWLHGEAVAAGMVMAIDLSIRHHWIDESVQQRLQHLLKQAELPIKSPPEMTVEKYLNTMSIDKKAVNGTIKLVLLRKLGEAFVTSDYNSSLLQQTLQTC